MQCWLTESTEGEEEGQLGIPAGEVRKCPEQLHEWPVSKVRLCFSLQL